MRKFIFIIFALLLTWGVANATNIPVLVDPKNYPTVWTELVYNGNTTNAAIIYSGYVVEWDFTSADSDVGTMFDTMGMWVKKGATNDGVWTAGVVPFGENIAYQSVGRIIIRGPAVVYRGVAGSALTAGQVCAMSTSGYVEDESISSGDTAMLGVVIAASAETADVGGDATADSSIIWVNPTTVAN